MRPNWFNLILAKETILFTSIIGVLEINISINATIHAKIWNLEFF